MTPLNPAHCPAPMPPRGPARCSAPKHRRRRVAHLSPDSATQWCHPHRRVRPPARRPRPPPPQRPGPRRPARRRAPSDDEFACDGRQTCSRRGCCVPARGQASNISRGHRPFSSTSSRLSRGRGTRVRPPPLHRDRGASRVPAFDAAGQRTRYRSRTTPQRSPQRVRCHPARFRRCRRRP